jgi:Eukaryotic translation initiation factor 3 subunit 8 N-terminus
MAKEKEAKKKMNIRFSRALNGMKQKVKKINKEYETEIKRFQEVGSMLFSNIEIDKSLSRIQKGSSVNTPLLLLSPR